MAQVFTRLLLATEHTEYDSGAEQMALTMAQRCKLPLSVVLPLVSNPEYEALAPQIATRAEQEAAVKIADLRAQANAAGVAIELRVRRGEEPYQEIVDEASQQNSDLIIIRRRGKRSFLAKLLVGEMVSKVVAHAPCNVVIVPRGALMWRQRVLVATEPTAQGRKVLGTAIAVAAECALPLQVVYVCASEAQQTQAQAFIAQALSLAQQGGVRAQGEVRRGKPYVEILAAADESGSDLIVMGSRGDPLSHRGRALVGGVAQKVLGLCVHAVLVQHFQKPPPQEFPPP